MTDISIIFGTYNRLDLLQRCVQSIRRNVGKASYEIVVTDGGSLDGSVQWLRTQLDCSVFVEPERKGAVSAFNDAFARSCGRYVLALNDDVEVLGKNTLELAMRRLDENPVVGQLAFAYAEAKCIVPDFRTYTMCRRTYANIGMIRRRVADKIVEIQGGFWNPLYHTYAADTELSCWVWRLGWDVAECLDFRCLDHLAQDELRASNNSGRNKQDGMLCHARWPDHRYIESMGPEPLVTPRELGVLRTWEEEKRTCPDCRSGIKRNIPCPLHGRWSLEWRRQARNNRRG